MLETKLEQESKGGIGVAGDVRVLSQEGRMNVCLACQGELEEKKVVVVRTGEPVIDGVDRGLK